MANLERIPIRYFVKSDPYNYIVDNRPLKDLNNRISLVNQEVSGILEQLRISSGTTESLSSRLGVSLLPSGKLKDGVLSDLKHSIANHEDTTEYVRMNTDERSKLHSIETGANNFRVSINGWTNLVTSILNFEDSSTIKLRMSSSGDLRAHTIVPSDYYHKHYHNMEPLVKCERDHMGSWVINEDIPPGLAIYKRALSTYGLLTRDAYTRNFYFYTNNGIPNGDNDGAPVSYRVGSLELVVNGVETPLQCDPTNHDDIEGRFKLAETNKYLPQWISQGDTDTMFLDWETPFDPETDLLEPLDQPSFNQFQVSEETYGIQETFDGHTVFLYELEEKPYGPINHWTQLSPGWRQLSTPTGTLSYGTLHEGFGYIPWNPSPSLEPLENTPSWKIIKKIPHSHNLYRIQYYLAWLPPKDLPSNPLSSPSERMFLFYQHRSAFSENSQPIFKNTKLSVEDFCTLETALGGPSDSYNQNIWGLLDLFVWRFKEELIPWGHPPFWKTLGDSSLDTLTQPSGMLITSHGKLVPWSQEIERTETPHWLILKIGTPEGLNRFYLLWTRNTPPPVDMYLTYQAVS